MIATHQDTTLATGLNLPISTTRSSDLKMAATGAGGRFGILNETWFRAQAHLT